MIHSCSCWRSRLKSSRRPSSFARFSRPQVRNNSSRQLRSAKKRSCFLRVKDLILPAITYPPFLRVRSLSLVELPRSRGATWQEARPCTRISVPWIMSPVVRIFDCKRSFGAPWLPTLENISAALIGQNVDSSCKVGDTECPLGTFAALTSTEFPSTIIMGRAFP
ncbi:hypothetical protein BJY00DRAFT_45144 [Aspergillus carlsbadensis]|nr:hypothetical protein BJY00DRAFT_45144 [Aspergillus carlsbadensis]